MGFGVGVYVGTNYDCKPSIIFIKNCVKNNLPTEFIPKEKGDNESN